MSEQLPWKPWQYVDEQVVAEITGLSLSSIQHQRCNGTGMPFRKLNGTTVRYKVADILAWMDAQPAGGKPACGKAARAARRKKAA
jgi:predicted DNA-binding transcriptional regulator AlpA